jgi:uncharacterized membrane protein
MADISDQVDIHAPADEVWKLLEDVSRLPDFSSSTVAVKDAPDRLTKKGQTFTQVVKAVGKRWQSQWTVLEIDPGHLLSSEGTVAPGVRFRLTQRLEARGNDEARLGLDIAYDVPGGRLGRIAARAGLERRAASEAKAVLTGIQRVAESEHKSRGDG